MCRAAHPLIELARQLGRFRSLRDTSDCNLTRRPREPPLATPVSFFVTSHQNFSCPRTTTRPAGPFPCNRLSAATFLDSMAFMRKVTAWRAPSASRFALAFASLSAPRRARSFFFASSSSMRLSVSVSRRLTALLHGFRRLRERPCPERPPVGSFSRQSDKGTQPPAICLQPCPPFVRCVLLPRHPH